ncbi:unnamed protein product [Caenorhabditis brenneri]
MTTTIDDPDIDYDTSFEVIETEEKFDVIEMLDDKNSENFQLISKKGETEREVNVDEDSMPILKSILGKWKPISSANLDEYAKYIGLNETETSIWKNGIMFYELKDGSLDYHIIIQSKIVQSAGFKINGQLIDQNDKFVYQVENNILKTICTNLLDGKEYWRIERFVKNGELNIVNDHGNFRCERKFQRIVSKKS